MLSVPCFPFAEASCNVSRKIMLRLFMSTIRVLSCYLERKKKLIACTYLNPKGSKGLFPNNANWHVIVFVCYIAEICCPFFSLFLYFLFYWKHLFLILVWDDMLLNRKVLVENNANTLLVFFFSIPEFSHVFMCFGRWKFLLPSRVFEGFLHCPQLNFPLSYLWKKGVSATNTFSIFSWKTKFYS